MRPCRNDVLESARGVVAHVKGPVECDRHRACKFDQPCSAIDVNITAGLQDAENHAVGPAFAANLDIPSHDVIIEVGIQEIPAPWPYHHIYGYVEVIPCRNNGPESGRSPAFREIAAQLDPVGPGLLSIYRGFDAVDANFKLKVHLQKTLWLNKNNNIFLIIV